MDRRGFTRMMAVAAGSAAGMTSDEKSRAAAGASSPVCSQAPGDVDQDAALPATDPVNVADFRKLAQDRLPQATFDYISTGSGDEYTLRDNTEAFSRLRVLPPLLKGVQQADTSTTVLQQKISLPLLLAPVAAQRMYHPQGVLAAARAAAAAGTVMGISSSAGNSVEEVAAASQGPKWFQLYMPKDRQVARRLVQRVEQAGFQAIIVTVDLGEWKDADRRNRFALPKKMLVKHLRDIGYEQVSNKMTDEQVAAFNAQAWDISLSWDVFGWLRGITKLPLLVKGVLRSQDAERAVAMGADGIAVSNHGGRRLDGMPATIDMLPEVVDATRGRAEVLLDSGVRRGTDVLKALALGAKAVLIGRPYAWALSADGEAGVRKVIELFREEIRNAMVATGCATVDQIDASLVLR
ncbi:MAG: alpha-hydroxy acid oxidase [Planctomycetaceae bacterium]